MSRTGYVSGGPDMESAQYFCLHACYLTIMRTRTPGSRKTFSSKINILWVTVSKWFDCVSDVVCQNTFLSPRPNLFAPESPKIRHWWLLAQFWNIVCWPLLAMIRLEKFDLTQMTPSQMVMKEKPRKSPRRPPTSATREVLQNVVWLFPAHCTFHTRGRVSPQFLRL